MSKDIHDRAIEYVKKYRSSALSKPEHPDIIMAFAKMESDGAIDVVTKVARLLGRSKKIVQATWGHFKRLGERLPKFQPTEQYTNLEFH